MTRYLVNFLRGRFVKSICAVTQPHVEALPCRLMFFFFSSSLFFFLILFVCFFLNSFLCFFLKFFFFVFFFLFFLFSFSPPFYSPFYSPFFSFFLSLFFVLPFLGILMLFPRRNYRLSVTRRWGLGCSAHILDPVHPARTKYHNLRTRHMGHHSHNPL